MSNAFTVPATAGAKFEIPEAGNHPAVLVALIDLGTHIETFQNKDKDGNVSEKRVPVPQIVLVWELVQAPMSGMKDANHLMAKKYSRTGSPKSNLRKLLEGWRGKAYAEGEAIDVSKVLGKACLVTVSHGTAKSSGNQFAKLENVGPVPKGLQVPAAKRKPVMVSPSFADPARFDAEIRELEVWVPYLVGEPIGAYLRQALEARGQAPAANGAPVQQGQPAQTEEEIPF